MVVRGAKRPSRYQELIELHNQGLIDREIAERLGVDPSTVGRRRKRLGLKATEGKGRRRPRRRKFTDQQLTEFYRQGLVDSEIGVNLEASIATVCYHRNRLGLKAYGKKRKFTDEQLIELYEQGLNDREIGKRLNASLSTVFFHRKKLGLKGIGHKRLFTDQQLIEFYEQGLNDGEMAKRLGVTRSTVGERRRNLGLKPVVRNR